MDAAVAKALDAAVNEAVAKAVAALPKPKDGAPGKDGKDVDPAVIERMVSDAVSKIPAPKDGRDGADGKDADPAYIDVAVAKAVEALPKPKDGAAGPAGKDGAPGPQGQKGADGARGKDADPLLIESLVSKAVAAIPAPKDGRDGKDGKDGRDGAATKDEIREIAKAAVVEAVPSVVAAEFEQRPDGSPRGVWKSGTPDYRRGNFVQLDGQTWQCNVTGTQKQPGNLNDDWTLVAKRGRDGRDRTSR